MGERLKNLGLSFVLLAAVYAALGLVLLVWPVQVMDALCYLTGGVLLLYGVFAVLIFWRAEGRTAGHFLSLLLGIVAAAVGVLLVLQPALFQSLLTVILGIYIAIDGLLNLKRALELRQLAFPGWGVCAGLSAASVALGLVVLFRPLLAGIALVRLIGAALLYIGLADLATLFLLWRLARHGRPADADPADPE